jgi:hypothetical protein
VIIAVAYAVLRKARGIPDPHGARSKNSSFLVLSDAPAMKIVVIGGTDPIGSKKRRHSASGRGDRCFVESRRQYELPQMG